MLYNICTLVQSTIILWPASRSLLKHIFDSLTCVMRTSCTQCCWSRRWWSKLQIRQFPGPTNQEVCQLSRRSPWWHLGSQQCSNLATGKLCKLDFNPNFEIVSLEILFSAGRIPCTSGCMSFIPCLITRKLVLDHCSSIVTLSMSRMGSSSILDDDLAITIRVYEPGITVIAVLETLNACLA